MGSLLSQGVSLAIFGMGTVFVFLTLLIFATALMSLVVARFSPTNSDAENPLKPALTLSEPSRLTTVIIAAAIHKHKQSTHNPS